MFEVHQDTFCEGWTNTWTTTDDNGVEIPERFETKEAAQKEIDEFLEEIAEDIRTGERDADNGYYGEEYRIYDLTIKEYIG
jgi:hypothetical protein